jgi:seryl-tRNA(Sec) selenium transferase
VPLLMDLGSGLLLSLEPYGLRGEPTVSDAVRDGATIVVMSGDKLLGGPQAGILVGTRQAIDACRRNPLTRALRVDKLTLAALEATLALYRDPERAVREIPVLAMVTAPRDAIRLRADAMSAGCGKLACPARWWRVKPPSEAEPSPQQRSIQRPSRSAARRIRWSESFVSRMKRSSADRGRSRTARPADRS